MLKFLETIKKLPPVFDNLALPASTEQLQEAQAQLSIDFPSSLSDLYSYHNGQLNLFGVGLFYGLKFLTLTQMVEHWTRLAPVEGLERYPYVSSKPLGAVKSGYRNSKWIPFAYDNGGAYLGIDYDPGENGVAGQVINFGSDEEVNVVLANSFQSFLDWYTKELDANNYTLSYLHEMKSKPSFTIKKPRAGHFFDVLVDIF